MNHALNDNPAAPGTACGRLARLVRLGVFACALAATGAGALAQDQDRNRRSDDAQARERYEMQAQRDARAFEVREQGRRNAVALPALAFLHAQLRRGGSQRRSGYGRWLGRRGSDGHVRLLG